MVHFGETQLTNFGKFTGKTWQKNVPRVITVLISGSTGLIHRDFQIILSAKKRAPIGGFFVLITFNIGGVVKSIYLYKSFEA